MRVRLRHVLLAALALIVAASALRACRNRADVPRDTAGGAPADRRVAAETDGGFTGFFRWFTGDGGGTAAKGGGDDVGGEEQLPATSELNDLSDKLEKAEKLPESVWYPNSTEKDEVERHSATLRELFMLGTMVRNGSATPEQREKYIEMKMKLLAEKVEMIRQFQDKGGPADDREEGDAMVRRLETEVSRLREELRGR